MKECPNCNAEINDSAVFCPSCGNDISTDMQTQQNHDTERPVSLIDKIKAKPTLLVIPVVIIVAIILYFTVFSSPHSGPEDVVEAFEDAINSRDAKDLYELAADPIHQKKAGVTPDGVEKYREYLSDCEREFGPNFKIDIDIHDVKKEESDSAIVYVTMTVKSRFGTESEETDIRTTKIDGKWYWED